MLELAARDESYTRILSVLGRGVRASRARMRGISGDTDPDWRDAVVDDECDVVETLLGAAFVVCQTQISAVSAAALQACHLASEGEGSGEYRRVKQELLAIDPSPLRTCPHSRIQVLNSLANYFKHRDEWRHDDWSMLRNRSKDTVRVIRAVGLRPRRSGNLRRGAKALGIATYDRMDVFADAISGWSEQVLSVVNSKLGP